MKSALGFTLLELVIAIGIIAVLSVVAIVNLSSIQQNSRDVKRQSDLRLIQGSLEQYYADQHNYPTVLTTTLVNGGRTYLNQVPTDPLSSNQPYLYAAKPDGCNNSTTKCTNYCIYGNLENPNNGSRSSPYNATCPQRSNYNFMFTQP